MNDRFGLKSTIQKLNLSGFQVKSEWVWPGSTEERVCAGGGGILKKKYLSMIAEIFQLASIPPLISNRKYRNKKLTVCTECNPIKRPIN
jgi:hypothetical protein